MTGKLKIEGDMMFAQGDPLPRCSPFGRDRVASRRLEEPVAAT